ncbi:MAG: VOC family protein [Porticoccaceae bacterium]
MIKITRINHSAISTKTPQELAEMERFYVGVLGMKTVERAIPEKLRNMVPGFWLQFGNGQIHVIQRDPAAQTEAMKGFEGQRRDPRGPHTAYFVEDIDAAEQHLIAEKIEYDRFSGFIFTADPAGNMVEFQQDPELAKPPA